ncbi:MAG: redox-regulated ATPase YchF [Candidatus Melainabacteria bacterium]|nr:redox-regulated ATPase YchF [Candidatus Melainabacteria bacterium]
MKVGIIGLPSCGKTSVFNALTGGHAQVHAFSASTHTEPNVGIVAVPDWRQDWLNGLYKPKKTTYATIEVVDVAGLVPGQSHKDGFSPQLLAHLRQVDALVHVVRAFKDPSVPHPNGSVDAFRDAELLELELILADLSVIERRLEKIDQEIQRKKGLERTESEAEKMLLLEFKEYLINEKPLRQVKLSAEQAKLMRGYTFASQKPLMVVANIDESEINKPDLHTMRKLEDFAQAKSAPLLVFCAKIEMEIAQLDESERAEFLTAIGIIEPSRDKLVKAAYELLEVIPFFTVGEDEVKAWTITRGTHAQEAARKIHSDIARGFIRAEVVPFDALKQCGTWVAAKDKGLVRLEGKDYVVQDGDCINFRFAV